MTVAVTGGSDGLPRICDYRDAGCCRIPDKPSVYGRSGRISAILSGSAAATDAPQKSQEPMSSPAAAETQRRHELARHL
jgi:hypothetical protein